MYKYPLGAARRRSPVSIGLSLIAVAALTLAGFSSSPLSALAAPTGLPQAAGECEATVSLINDGFEQPELTEDLVQIDAGEVPGWSTTDNQNKIELWTDGNQGVPAAEGNQFAELNATSPSMLYQTVQTTPGQTLSWSLKHRGRDGEDSMRVMIGSSVDNLTQSGPNLTDGNSEWGSHTGEYTVPAGQTSTVFGFQAVSSAGGVLSVGNLLDDITFGSEPCLTTTKAVTNVTRGGESAQVGDVLRYTVVTNNEGGTPALNTLSTDELESGLNYVPGSMKITEGPGEGDLTDASGDDAGEFNGNTVTVGLGTDAKSSDGGSLDAKTTTRYTFDAKVTRAAVENGAVKNTADVEYHSKLGDKDKSVTTNTTETPIVENPAVSMTKSVKDVTDVNSDGQHGAGDTVTYEFTVKNTGDTNLDESKITDDLLGGAVECAALDNTLAPGAETTCTSKPYEITQADIDSSVVHNEASVSATSPAGTVVTDEDAADQPLMSSSSISLGKKVAGQEDVDGDGNVSAGDKVKYSFTVTNTGLTSLDKAQLNDEMLGGNIQCTALSETLAPKASVDCGPIEHTLTQQDVDSGTVHNEATVTAQNPKGEDVRDNAVADVNVEGVDAIQLSKRATGATDTNGDGFTGADDEVSYSFTIANIGTTTLNDARLTDELLGGNIECAKLDGVSLAPRSSVECGPVTYTLTQKDVDAGNVLNTASVKADGSNGEVSDESKADVTIGAAPGLSIDKTADVKSAKVGDTVNYSFTVKNTGNVTLTDVKVNEDDFSGSGKLSELECPELRTLAPGETADCTASYVVTQVDVDSGELTNTASAGATDPSGTDTKAGPDEAIVAMPEATPGLSIDKTADVKSAKVGDTVNYSFTVKNTGNVTLTDVKVNEDDFSGSGKLNEPECPEPHTLAPGETADCTAKYVVTQADADSGKLINVANAEGNDPKSNGVKSDPDDAQVAMEKAPAPTPQPDPDQKDRLPRTGIDGTEALVAMALALVTVGAVMYGASRRRRQGE